MGLKTDQVFQAIPFVGWIVGAATVCLGVLIFVFFVGMVRARQARNLDRALRNSELTHLPRPSIWPEVIGVLSLLLTPIAVAVSIQSSRQLIIGLLHPKKGTTDPSNTASLLAYGIAGQMNGIPLAVLLIVPLLFIGAVAIGYALYYRLRINGLRAAASAKDEDEKNAWLAFPGPSMSTLAGSILPFLGLGLLPLAWGGFSYVARIIQGSATMAGLDPALKAKHLLDTLLSARVVLEHGFMVAGGGLVLAAVIAAMNALVFSASRRRRQLAPRLRSGISTRNTAIASCSCVIAASLLFFLAAPYYEENSNPLPARLGGQIIAEKEIATPDIRGPDKITSMPVLAVTTSSAKLDGVEMRPAQLKDHLMVMKHNWKIIHPNAPYPGEIILLSDKNTKVDRLLPFIAAALVNGHQEILFAFTKSEKFDRPILGKLERLQESATRVKVMISEQPVMGTMRALKYITYDELARAATKRRDSGKEARVTIPESAVNQILARPQ